MPPQPADDEWDMAVLRYLAEGSAADGGILDMEGEDRRLLLLLLLLLLL